MNMGCRIIWGHKMLKGAIQKGAEDTTTTGRMWKEMAVIDEIMNYSSSAYRQAFASDQGAWW
jgi:hypothetical protein